MTNAVKNQLIKKSEEEIQLIFSAYNFLTIIREIDIEHDILNTDLFEELDFQIKSLYMFYREMQNNLEQFKKMKL